MGIFYLKSCVCGLILMCTFAHIQRSSGFWFWADAKSKGAGAARVWPHVNRERGDRAAGLYVWFWYQ